MVISILLSIIDRLIGTHSGNTGLLAGRYGLAVLLPSLAVQVRRLHDTDRSGWWILIGLVPFVAAIILLVFDVLPGDASPNRFGGDPKGLGQPDGPAPATA